MGLLIWLKNVEIIWISTIQWLITNLYKKTTKNKSKRFSSQEDSGSDICNSKKVRFFWNKAKQEYEEVHNI